MAAWPGIPEGPRLEALQSTGKDASSQTDSQRDFRQLGGYREVGPSTTEVQEMECGIENNIH
jgi:hypothetical protein